MLFRSNIAISDEIEIRLKREFGVYPNSVEGRRQAEWILMDYVDFIVHVFSPEKRAFYGLERLRKSATSLSIAELNAELKERIAASRTNASKKTPTKAAATKKSPVKAAPKKAAPKKATSKKAPAKKTAAKKATAASAPSTRAKTAKKAPLKKAATRKTSGK